MNNMTLNDLFKEIYGGYDVRLGASPPFLRREQYIHHKSHNHTTTYTSIDDTYEYCHDCKKMFFNKK